MAPSAVPNPGTLCEPPRTARSEPVSRAKLTTATTSLVEVHSTTASGRRSIMKL